MISAKDANKIYFKSVLEQKIENNKRIINMAKNFSQVEQIFTNMIEAYKDIDNVRYDEFHAFIQFKSEKEEEVKIRKDVFLLIQNLVEDVV